MIKISNIPIQNDTDRHEKPVKTVYCLYRVSTKNQVESNDIPMQKIACHQFADSKTGWIIRREFYELGVSGFKVSAAERDQIQELKTCAENGEFDVLLVFMYDRLGRRDDETPFVLRWFYENGIEIWSVKEGQKVFDSTTDDLLNYMYFWAAKSESLKTAMRVRTKLRQMVSEGKYTGGTAPFGYRLIHSGEFNSKGRSILKHEIIPDEAELVKMIFIDTAVYGMGSHVLAEKLNRKGVKTHNGAKFQSNSIKRILRNPIYCGFFYKAGILSPRIEEMQIVDDSLFNEAQRVLDNRSSLNQERNNFRYSNSDNLLSGNVYCECCGGKMCANSNTYSYKSKSGEIHIHKRTRYICSGRTLSRNECEGQGTFTAKYVDAFVCDFFNDCLHKISDSSRNVMLENRYKNALSNLNLKVAEYEAEKDKHAERIKILYDRVADSLVGNCVYDPQILSEAIMHEKEQLSFIERKLSSMHEEINDKLTLRKSMGLRFDELSVLLNDFQSCEFARKRMIANKLIKKVTVGKGNDEKYRYKIDIQLNEWYADLL